MPWRLTVRAGPQVEHARFDELRAALDAVEERGRAIAQGVPRKAVDVRFRRFEPIQLVAARIELAGPQRILPTVWAGIDVRGDGSMEAYLGRVKREVVEQRKGETPYRALRRAVATRVAR